MILTVGQMRAFLEKYEDDVKIITASDNPELSGNFVDTRISESTVIMQRQMFRDMMDYTSYPKDVYVFHSEGEKVIRITGR